MKTFDIFFGILFGLLGLSCLAGAVFNPCSGHLWVIAVMCAVFVAVLRKEYRDKDN
jgi:hypothetical protein